MAHISQREARRLRKRVEALEEAEDARRYTWAEEWPCGVELRRLQWLPADPLLSAIITARKLKHAVVVVAQEAGVVRFVALPIADARIGRRRA